MKQTILKFFSLVLVIASLMAVGLTGCVPDDSESTERSSTSGTIPGTDGVVFSYVPDDLPELDFGGTEVNFLYRGGERFAHEIHKENYNPGDKLDHAVFLRNEKVQDKLNIKFKFIPEVDGATYNYNIVEMVRKAGQDGAYDIVSNANQTTHPMASTTNGSFLNLKKLNYLNLDKDYWAKYINDGATLNGAIYFATGSISLYMYESLFVCYMNRNLCTNYGIDPDSVYQLVNTGNWTLSKMIKMTQDIYEDAGTNPGVKDLGDVYGFAMELLASTNGYWSSCDIRMTSTNTDGTMQWDLDVNKLSKVVKDLNNFVWKSKGVIPIVGEAELADSKKFASIGHTLIGTDKVLFANDRLYDVRSDEIRNCDHYGIIPYPKYNERQESYYSFVQNSYSVFAVPLGVKDRGVVGATLEALASTNHNEVLPEYYDDILTSRYINDPKCVKMLDIIFQNVKMDPALVFEISGTPDALLRDFVLGNNNNVTSQSKSVASLVNAKFKSWSEAYGENANK